jgi:mono/diheme cytochrome c family protein
MRKLFLLPIILIGMIAVYFSACSSEKKESSEPTVNKDSIDKVIARGEYLARNVAGCIDCHSQRDLTKFSAPVVPGTEGGGGFAFIPAFGLPGTFYGKNITPDVESGIGGWTDEEVLRAITQGISKNGDTLFPLMPYPSFNRIAKDDLMSIIAYIRTLKPLKNKVQPRQLLMPIAVAYPGKFLQPSVDGNVRPPENDQVKYGEYLITLAECSNCHTPVSPQGPDRSKMYAGNHIFDAGRFKVASSNITPDSATGLGTWTEERFLNKFTIYRDKSNYDFVAGKENTLMPLSEYAGMKDEDLKAIYAYLRTVKPISNKVEKYPK